VENAADEVKEKAAVVGRALEKEVESRPRPLPPVKISNDFTVTDLEKPTALFLFREDFAADNRITFNGKFRSRWVVKWNAFLAVRGNSQAPAFELLDDAQINGPIGRNSLQLKFKQKKLSAQLDFNHHLIHNDYELATKRHNFYTFLNPYLYFECDRSLRNHLYGLGWMTYISTKYRDHWRFNFSEKENKLSWDLTHNMLFRHRGFFANWVLGLTTTDTLFFNDRRFMIGYDRDEINVNVEAYDKKGTIRDWAVDAVTASASYDFRERGLLGIYASKFFGEGTDPNRLQDLSFGYRNKLRRDLEFKTKVSTTGLVHFFFNYRVRDGLNVHTSFLGALTDKTKKGFLEMPFDLGLKIKLEN